jgi:hypothetical protein
MISKNQLKRIILPGILVVVLTGLPLLIVDSESDFYQKQGGFAILLNIVSIFLIVQFLNLLKTPHNYKIILLISLTAWFCILPTIFYKIYIKNPISFSYNQEYINSLKNINEENISTEDSLFIKLNSLLKKEFYDNVKDTLPKYENRLLFYKNFVVLSPTTIRTQIAAAPITYISIYNRLNGKFLLKFPKKNNVRESYKYFTDNLKFKIDKIHNPKIGIDYFDFWCSSIIGFRDNLIIPLRSWILLLNFIFISIMFVPLYNFIQTNFLKKINNDK